MENTDDKNSTSEEGVNTNIEENTETVETKDDAGEEKKDDKIEEENNTDDGCKNTEEIKDKVESTGECSGTSIKFVKSSSTRNYRKHALEDPSTVNSDTDEEEESASAEKKIKTSDGNETNNETPIVNDETETDSNGPVQPDVVVEEMALLRSNSSSSSSSNDDDDDDDDDEEDRIGFAYIHTDGRFRRRLLSLRNDVEVVDEETPKVLTKQKPKHKWSITREIMNRQYGASSHIQAPYKLHTKYYGSLHSVQRMELMYKLESHRGCVNSINFNQSGNKLVSGSDDQKAVIWNWAAGKKIAKFNTGHRSNIFQSKFIHYSNDSQIITCARDGHVRLHTMTETGKSVTTTRVAVHGGSANRLALNLEEPKVVLSCGDDTKVFNIDLRESSSQELLRCKVDGSDVELFSISSNPGRPYEFALGGQYPFVLVYDKRCIRDSEPLKIYRPHNLAQRENLHLTGVCYNYNGSELLISYNDDYIYLFDTSHSSEADCVHKYEGHRNNATVKGVNFFGPKSEFVISGSDCGHIFFWDKDTESIVQFLKGDENGIVNCLEPHPHIPVLATSGLDHDVKIWIPSKEEEPALEDLKHTVTQNQKMQLAACDENRITLNFIRSLRRGGQLRPFVRGLFEGFHAGSDSSDDSSTDRNVLEDENAYETSSQDDDDDSDGEDNPRRRAFRQRMQQCETH